MVEGARTPADGETDDHRASTDRDRERVQQLLGRRPGGRYQVVVRNDTGDPVVIRNAPRLDDGTPMPTRYWLVGPAQVAAVSRLESAGGVRAAEAAVDAAALAAAHARYAAERDAELPDDGAPRPSGGVAGTREGVKCLHAHYAWHLAGGDDPVGRWVARQLTSTLVVEIGPAHTTVRHGDWAIVLPVDPRSLLAGELSEYDPPSASSLTNALGLVTDHIDDVLRERPEIIDSRRVELWGDDAWQLACVERGTADLASAVTIGRDDLEDLFRTLATETRVQRRHNPALRDDHVELIVATCCIVLAMMRRLLFADAVFTSSAGGGDAFAPAPVDGPGGP